MTAPAGPPPLHHRLLSGRLLVRNIAWNLLGAAVPVGVAAWAIPLLVTGLGTERFGLLTIVWMGVGYFSLFDLGIGRALTKLVAQKLGDGDEAAVPGLVRTGMLSMALLGVFSGLLVWILAPWACRRALDVPAPLVNEAIASFRLLGAALPFVISSTGLVGVLQAFQRFRVINAVRVPLGVVSYVGPVLVLPFTDSLVAATGVLAAARVTGWAIYLRLARRRAGGAAGEAASREERISMYRFGAWTTVSNVVSPLMASFDRFYVGSALGMAAVAYYTTPYELITRLWVVPDAVVAVLYPALATGLAAGASRIEAITERAVRCLLLALALPVGAVLLWAPEGLHWWLGAEFAMQSSPVLRWLAAGVLVNSVSRVPFGLLQSAGRPDLTAKLHLLELPVYVVALVALISHRGIEGAAMAWTLRIVVDSIATYSLVLWHLPTLRLQHLRSLAATVAAAGSLALLVLPEGNAAKLVAGAALLGVVLCLGWRELRDIREMASR